MSAAEEAAKRLVNDIWTAARDPRVNKDPAAIERWRTYGIQKVAGIIAIAEAEERAAWAEILGQLARPIHEACSSWPEGSDRDRMLAPARALECAAKRLQINERVP